MPTHLLGVKGTNMTVIDLINRDFPEFEDTDPEWVLFLEDHRAAILSEASILELTDDIIVMYENRSEDLLERMRYPRSLSWIFLWLNGIFGDEDFIPASKMIFPEVKTISFLREQFKTYRQVLAQNSL
jgi:hypothetical protein